MSNYSTNDDMDRVRQMEIFIQVMESGNFTRAAAVLGIPRTTISTTIQALEDRLGTQLLRRTTRRMLPTPDGLRFLETATEITRAVTASEQMFAATAVPLQGRLRIDMPSRIGRRIILPALPALMDEHPGLEIEIGLNDRSLDLVAEGVDCAIRVGALGQPGLVCRKLGEVALITCASPGYLDRHGLPTAPNELSRHLRVVYAPARPVGPAEWCHGEGRDRQCIEMQSRIAVANVEAYIAAGIAGLGLIQVPAFDVQDLLESGELVEIMPGFRPPPMPLSFLYVGRRNTPARIAAFQSWVAVTLRGSGVI